MNMIYVCSRTEERMGFSLALVVENGPMMELCYASGWKSNANMTQKRATEEEFGKRKDSYTTSGFVAAR